MKKIAELNEYDIRTIIANHFNDEGYDVNEFDICITYEPDDKNILPVIKIQAILEEGDI